MTPGAPFDRVAYTLPSQLTGETSYMTDRGQVWTERFPGDGIVSGGQRARLVNGYVIPEPIVITMAPEPKPTERPSPAPNRHERRRNKALSRRKP